MMMFGQSANRLPTRYFFGSFEVGTETSTKLDAIYAKPQNQWSTEECALVASLQRLSLSAQGLLTEIEGEGR